MRLISKFISIIITIVMLIVFITGGLYLYITVIERNLISVKNHNLIIDEHGNDTLKIVQFSDTQLGEFYTLDNLQKAVDEINDLDADLVLFTGDLIDHAASYEERHKIASVLAKIQSNLGKYAVYGNHDHGGGAIRYYEDIMNDGGFTILKNSNEKVIFNDKTINLFGGDDALIGNHNPLVTMNGFDENNFNILMIHEPDLANEYKDYPIDLILSGHSHGGQVYIPFYGPIYRNSLSKDFNRGFYELDNETKTKLYVNTGLGNTKVPYRFFTIPEITLFNITM